MHMIWAQLANKVILTELTKNNLNCRKAFILLPLLFKVLKFIYLFITFFSPKGWSSAETIPKSIEGIRLESDTLRVQLSLPSAQTKNRNRNPGIHPHPHLVKYRCCLQLLHCTEVLSPHNLWSKSFKVTHCSVFYTLTLNWDGLLLTIIENRKLGLENCVHHVLNMDAFLCEKMNVCPHIFSFSANSYCGNYWIDFNE